MRNVALAFTLLVLLVCNCRQNEEKTYEPALRLELSEVSAGAAVIAVTSIDAEKVAYGVSSSGEPALTDTMETGGTGSMKNNLRLESLTPGTDYLFCAQGVGPGGEKGKKVSLNFSTAQLSGSMYS